MSLLLLVSALSWAEPSHTVTTGDQFTLDEIRGLAANLNGTRAVYVLARWDEALDRQRTDLWTLDTRTRVSTRLTFDLPDAHQPRFGPLGQHIYFLAKDAEGHSQVWRVAAAGGAPMALTHAPAGVEHYDLDTNGGLWWLTNSEQPVADDWAALRKAHDKLSYAGRTQPEAKLHRVDLNSWRTEQVWTSGRHVVALDVTEDGARFAAITAPQAPLIWHEGWSDVRVVEVSTAAEQVLPDASWRAEAPSPYGWLDGVSWASDGRALAVGVDFDGYPGETFVAEFAGNEPRLWKVPRPANLQNQGGVLQWVPGERELCQRMADRGRVRLMCTPKLRAGTVGKPDVFPRGDVVVNTFAFSGDGRDVYAMVGTPTRFPDLYRLPARGSLLPVQLVTTNPQTASWKLPTTRIVSWTSPDGTAVEGILETPYGWTPEQGPLPTMLLIHGGPTAMETVQRTFSYGGRTTLASHGYAVLAPNYRGSLGYGDAFTTALIGHENDVDVADVLSGVDHLVTEGIADPAKLAVMGWSNGGYLTNAVIARTDRFKAAISGAGVIDQSLQWATEDTPGHVVAFMEGLPWTQPDAYRAASPIYGLDKVKTPTLIHVGDRDERVPPEHAQALFRALDVYLDVPTELVLYPGSPHGLRKLSERKAKVAWDLAWLDRWVMGVTP